MRARPFRRRTPCTAAMRGPRLAASLPQTPRARKRQAVQRPRRRAVHALAHVPADRARMLAARVMQAWGVFKGARNGVRMRSGRCPALVATWQVPRSACRLRPAMPRSGRKEGVRGEGRGTRARRSVSAGRNLPGLAAEATAAASARGADAAAAQAPRHSRGGRGGGGGGVKPPARRSPHGH